MAAGDGQKTWETEKPDTKNQRNAQPDSTRLGSVGEASQGFRHEPDETADSDSEGTDRFGSDRTRGRKGSAGGILRQLREVRQLHLAFVDAHTERLKARLADDERHRSQLISSMDSLEEEILEALKDNEDDDEQLEETD